MRHSKAAQSDPLRLPPELQKAPQELPRHPKATHRRNAGNPIYRHNPDGSRVHCWHKCQPSSTQMNESIPSPMLFMNSCHFWFKLLYAFLLGSAAAVQMGDGDDFTKRRCQTFFCEAGLLGSFSRGGDGSLEMGVYSDLMMRFWWGSDEDLMMRCWCTHPVMRFSWGPHDEACISLMPVHACILLLAGWLAAGWLLAGWLAACWLADWLAAGWLASC